MSDLISRQAVDDVMYDYSRSHDVDYAQIMERIDELPSVENKGEWIPVSERLPEEGTHILVSVRGEPDFVATDDYYSYGFDDWKDDVTAWQPLPEPYKGESEEV